MDREDLKAIDRLLKKNLKEIKETQETQTGKILGIERDIKAALELRQDVSEFRKQIKDHEDRISELETI